MPVKFYEWVEAAQRYRDPATGRFVPFAVVDAELEASVQASVADMGAVSQRLADGAISLDEWKMLMRQEIKDAHNTATCLARGGRNQMSPSDWGWVGRRTRDQYDFLERFARDVAGGKQALNGNFHRRVAMYARAARGTYQEMRARMARQHGAVEERRVLGPAEHCVESPARPGCVEQAALSWRPFGELAPIGGCTCLTMCRCTKEYRDAAGKLVGAQA